jgi:hypothetical protein
LLKSPARSKAGTAVFDVLSAKEQAAIEAARRSGFVSDADIAAFWKRHGIE